jgi:hypothetical protein
MLLGIFSALILQSIFIQSAQAIPLFARQVQQNCVACHVGGQYPELTAYGRYFKLTGYTQGDQQWDPANGKIPFAMSIQAGSNTMKNNKSNSSTGDSPDGAIAGVPVGSPMDYRNGNFKFDQVSVYAGGKITDNLGLFAQYTWAFNGPDSNGNPSPAATWNADNFDLRAADHYSSGYRDLIFGASLNNNPGVTDVFNSSPAYAYPYQLSSTQSGQIPPYKTQIESYGGGSARGVNGYVYLNRNWYAEIGGYTANTGATKFLTITNDAGNPTRNNTTNLVGINPYYRLAGTYEWGSHNIMLGAFGMNSRIAQLNNDGVAFNSNVPIPSGTAGVLYQDRALDAQYQYISDPHVISAQVRYIQENISDPSNLVYANPTNNLYSRYAKAMYVYQAKYGATLAYWSQTGSQDSGAYSSGIGNGAAVNPGSLNYASFNNSPNSNAWIPAIFWQPLQNVRITLQQTFWTKFVGGTTNYDNGGRNASDNNTTYLYLWMAY